MLRFFFGDGAETDSDDEAAEAERIAAARAEKARVDAARAQAARQAARAEEARLDAARAQAARAQVARAEEAARRKKEFDDMRQKMRCELQRELQREMIRAEQHRALLDLSARDAEGALDRRNREYTEFVRTCLPEATADDGNVSRLRAEMKKTLAAKVRSEQHCLQLRHDLERLQDEKAAKEARLLDLGVEIEKVTSAMLRAQEEDGAFDAKVSTLRLGDRTPADVLRQCDVHEKAIREATEERDRTRALVHNDLRDAAAGRKRKRCAEHTSNGGAVVDVMTRSDTGVAIDDAFTPDVGTIALENGDGDDGDGDGDGDGANNRAKRARTST